MKLTPSSFQHFYHQQDSSTPQDLTGFIGFVVGHKIGQKHVVVEVGRDRMLAEIENWFEAIKKGDLIRVVGYSREGFPIVKKFVVEVKEKKEK